MKYLIMPILLSIVGAGLWAVLYLSGWNSFVEGDQEVMTNTITFVGIAHSLFASFILKALYPQWKGIREAVKAKDRDKFKLHTEKELPESVKGLMMLLSLILVAAFYFLGFENFITGIFTQFVVVLLVTTYWVVIADLDGPFKGFWNVTNIPKEWLEK